MHLKQCHAKAAEGVSLRPQLNIALPCLQCDGEPWKQAPAQLDITLKSVKAHMLRRLDSEPLAQMARTVADVLDACVTDNVITPAQKHRITTDLAAKLHPLG